MQVAVDLPAGLNSNSTPYSTQQSYRDADKVRFLQGRAEVIGGWEAVSKSYIPGACRDILPWKDNIGQELICYGSSQGLYVLQSGNIHDITPSDVAPGSVDGTQGPGWGSGAWGVGAWGLSSTPGNYGPRTWSLSNFGQAVVANPRNGSIYMWNNDVTQKAVIVANAPTEVAFTMVSQERQILAFGCNQSADGVYNPLAFRCSDVDGNYTTWAITAQNNADEVILPSGGELVAACQWGPDLAVWTQAGLYRGTFVGNTNQVWRFDAVDGAAGLLGPNAAVVIGQTAFWLGRDEQLYACTLGQAPQVVECPIRTDSLAHIAPAQGDKVILSYVSAANELRIDYPDARDGAPGTENSRYLSMHIVSGAWSRGTQSRTAMTHGGPIQWPIGAQAVNLALPYPNPIVDLASAQAALAVLQAKATGIKGVNLVLRANTTATHGSVVQILTGKSQWGVRLTGDGSSAASMTISGLGLTAGQRVSISYRAQTIAGPAVSATAALGSDLSAPITITPAFTAYHHANVAVTAADNFTISAGVLKTGAVVEITDIKIELGGITSAWTPSPNAPDLFSLYLPFLQSITYSQLVSRHYYHELNHGADGDDFEWFIETNDFAMDENRTAMLVKQFKPDLRDQIGNVSLTVFLRMFPHDKSEIVIGPFPIDDTTEQVDMLAVGKIARFRLSGSGLEAYARVGRSIFEVVAAGVR